MVKVAAAQFINTSISILIINLKIKDVQQWNKDFPIFTGMYPDFDSSWFKNVGATITFAVAIGAFVPHGVALLDAMLVSCRKFCDSGNLIGKNSKIFVKSSFMAIYVGPQFNVDLEYAGVKMYI
jgi:hypothetical protein